MANGDAAAAAGLEVFPATQDARLGYDNDNIRGDELADHIVNGGHPWAKITGKPILVQSFTGQDIRLRYDGRALWYVDGLEFALAKQDETYSRAVIDAAFANTNGTIAAVDAALGSKANAFEDVNATRYTRGPDGTAYGRTVAGSGFAAVWMDNTLQFGRNTSARKYKEHIEPYPIDPAAVLALQPVSYHRKSNDTDEREFGLIADDVEQLLPEVCTYHDGEIDGIRYDLLGVALLAVVQDQARQLDQLRARLDKLEGQAD